MKGFINYLKKHRTLGMLIAGGFPLVVILVAVMLTTADKTPEWRKVAGVERVGYESYPEHYIVEASPNKKWKETSKAWLILGLIIASVGGAVAIAYSDYNPEGPNSNRTGFTMLIAWFLGAIIVFAPYVAKHGDSKYETKLCQGEFRQALEEGTLDSFFPGVEKKYIKCD